MQKYIKNIIKNRMLGGYDLNLVAVVGISTLVLVLKYYYPLNIDFPPGNRAHLLPAHPAGGGLSDFQG